MTRILSSKGGGWITKSRWDVTDVRIHSMDHSLTQHTKRGSWKALTNWGPHICSLDIASRLLSVHWKRCKLNRVLHFVLNFAAPPSIKTFRQKASCTHQSLIALKTQNNGIHGAHMDGYMGNTTMKKKMHVLHSKTNWSNQIALIGSVVSRCKFHKTSTVWTCSLRQRVWVVEGKSCAPNSVFFPLHERTARFLKNANPLLAARADETSL